MQTRSSLLAEQAHSRQALHTPQLKQHGAAQVLDTRDMQSVQRQAQSIANQSTAASQLKLLQAKMAGRTDVMQRVEEEELVQGKFDTVQRVEEEELVQGKFTTVQRVEEEELVQGKFGTAQLQEKTMPNNTGLPHQLKSGIESLSGISMDHVKVHYNSSQPAQLNAHAYAQGSDIHVAPGQEQHLPHEAWHVVQQAQGRVQPTMQMKEGVPVNDDVGLEVEADVMGARALSLTNAPITSLKAINWNSQIKQFAPNRVHLVNNATHYQTGYSDMVGNFTGGASAGGAAMPTPASYNAQYTRQNSNGNQVAALNVNVLGTTREYHHGHMLADAMGGGGGSDNVFLQDGGQNTTGAWPSWERTVANDLANAPSNHSASIGIELVK